MRDDDGRKLDHKTLEQLRIRAVRQIEQGAHRGREIAPALGMTRAAVYGWLANYREGGLEALKARPVAARPPTLSGSQLQRISTWLSVMIHGSCRSPLGCGPGPWCGS